MLGADGVRIECWTLVRMAGEECPWGGGPLGVVWEGTGEVAYHWEQGGISVGFVEG